MPKRKKFTRVPKRSIAKKKPKKPKKDLEDGDFQPDDDDEQSDEMELEEEQTPPPKRSRKQPTSTPKPKPLQTPTRTPKPPQTPKTPKTPTNYTSDGSESTYDRPQLTAKGGYSHTKSSKQKIGQANKGKKPWNKGRHRSAADRAKISAGVRARNRIALLKKLDKLGLTEEQYQEQKRQDKLKRESIRRRKLSERKNMEKQLKKQGLELEKKKKKEEVDRKKEAIRSKLSREVDPGVNVDKEQNSSGNSNTNLSDDNDSKKSNQSETAGIVFSREFVWKHHPFDTKEIGTTYNDCPSNGNGGLICCKFCTSSYSRYLSHTTKDMEVKTIQKIGREVHEIVELLHDANAKLQNSIESSHSNTSIRSYLHTNASRLPAALQRTAPAYIHFDPSMTSIMDVCAPSRSL